ncbi:uncharacterized protein EKO05_0002850 [Ascochyta rabiei]|uniref:MINDY deubiquitinase domain-containing protein n=1 Tax=Didymella rabiei TaxID=5454 RepID=A0A163L092_DIDRA|nr:uncharacterized protein EKO05_0002850 [Ascochyta rabiei]KZM27392.1 hypothetical protein ST47_g1462 [Ascochyta rabiei]UPX12296.1 hypothetical protein EKO05_0002850 [Ascochyta rabiei]
MVMKPSTDQGLVPAPLSKANPPYPLTPGEERLSAVPSAPAHNAYPPSSSGTPAFNFKTPDIAHPQRGDDDRLLDDDSDYSDEDWDKSDDDDAWDDPSPAGVPDALRPAGGKAPAATSNTEAALPDALRAGPPAGVPIKKSWENLSLVPIEKSGENISPVPIKKSWENISPVPIKKSWENLSLVPIEKSGENISPVPIKKSWEDISPMPTGASAVSYGGVSTISNDGSTSSVPLKTNNPYLKMQATGQSTFDSDNVWGDSHGHSQRFEPVELPAHQTPATPTNHMANLNIGNDVPQQQREPSVDQPPLIALEGAVPHPEPPRHDSTDANPWSTVADAAPLNGRPESSSPQETHTAWQEPDIWQQHEPTRQTQEAPRLHSAAQSQESYQDQQVPAYPSHQPQPPVQSTPPHAEQDSAHVATPPTYTPPSAPQSLPPPVFNAQGQSPPSPLRDEPLPPLPPRRSLEEQPPPFPPRPLETGITGATSPGPESPNAAMNRQRREHYQIKHIRWHDVNKPGIRTSPILTQNLNGPCPLLALVNALVLSTPSGTDTALVETLRTREQVSLGLLLDAVFDELMSGRRGDAAQELPDVSDLYKFLLALHTGLNVNPMFVPDSEATHGNTALAHRPGAKAGGFENTPDMRLYRTFDIPLIHGWLPEAGSEAYQAFERVAKSYETSQYVQFQEEELDAKLQSGEALSDSEQQMFTDIHAIKEFLSQWPTQLTDHGLKVMKDSLQPGQVVILFRNDHFSTVFKDPRTQNLVTLVTDQGYSTHDEIVWESLVDVNGMGSELFSGDFRPVGNHDSAPQAAFQQQEQAPVDDNRGWTTVPTRRPTQQQSAPAAEPATRTDESTSSTGLSRAEQEDHDLALALQLQEEEEDRERRGAEQRVRDNEASENAIAAQARERPANRRASRPGEQPPIVPPRRSNITGYRPNEGPAPPPTYEEASTVPQYNPPPGHPASSSAPLPGQGSAYHGNSGSVAPGTGPSGRRFSGRQPSTSNIGRPGRRQSAGVAGPNGEEREKCVVM